MSNNTQTGAGFGILNWIKANKLLFAGGLVLTAVAVYGLIIWTQKSIPEPIIVSQVPKPSGKPSYQTLSDKRNQGLKDMSKTNPIQQNITKRW